MARGAVLVAWLRRRPLRLDALAVLVPGLHRLLLRLLQRLLGRCPRSPTGRIKVQQLLWLLANLVEA